MIWMFAAVAAQALAGGLSYGQAAKAQKQENESIKAYNKAVQATTARQLTEININRAVSRAQTAQALDTARRQGIADTSARNLQAAASDTMGASVTQNLQDVQVQLDAAEGNLMRNAEVQELSFDSQVTSTVDSARNAIKELSGPVPTDYAGLGSMVGSIGTSIAGNKMAGLSWSGEAITPAKAAPITAATGTRSTGLSTRLKL
ncbi:internal virion protein A [Pectobacterium phage PP16]|uniref:Internal virion protein A n=1 Tax=Pectobacterium phage PP16 TaxID=1873958 RepID=A0A1B1PEE1_9CAUD|nr:internal virion protein [Pectobacterium phage PP16]ANT45343.1 internal virion protein A [Pectobacterium phage PP16]